MTDLITRPIEEERRDVPTAGVRAGTKRTIIGLAVVIGILAGWVVFSNLGPSRTELERAHWQQVVDYYEQTYPAIAESEALREAAHWQQVVDYYEQTYPAIAESEALREAAHWQLVVDHYARQYELVANATQVPAADRASAHWEAVVNYYKQQWESRGQ